MDAWREPGNRSAEYDAEWDPETANACAGAALEPALHRKAGTEPVGAGVPANTGDTGAMQRVVFFAGKPAPTGPAVTFSFAQYLWERL
ncbi:hypothetical protein PPUN109347_47410 [Pseudomonas putida]|nr:hypothetical protein PPUN109347_47410 [Pseudomonas putida]